MINLTYFDTDNKKLSGGDGTGTFSLEMRYQLLENGLFPTRELLHGMIYGH